MRHFTKFFFFFFNDTATTEIYTLSLHDALPISQPLELLLDVGPLAANAFQPLLVIPQLLIEGGRSLRGEGRCKKSVAERRRENTSRKTVVAVTPFRDVSSRRLSVTPHTRRRCLPTDAALPNSPISVPNPTMASACRFEKNAAWMSQRLMSVYAP